ncbi:MAG: hydroxyphenylacetyl-CoA thioesterase PaaI [Candidatus Eremiobacteraeota bacterium]|nr:hydroxyphenylacetyl-CoA thioesterase PaaI [Candidatus Eremiobacteraeota bacterium]
MYARDAASRWLDISIEEVRPGYARLSMHVTESMLNGHDVAHGGLVFTLADTAFAYACNSRNERNVALNAAISFAAPARLGDKLVAVAEERSRAGRTGVYDVEVQNQSQDTLALFRGTSYRITGSLY